MEQLTLVGRSGLAGAEREAAGRLLAGAAAEGLDLPVSLGGEGGPGDVALVLALAGGELAGLAALQEGDPAEVCGAVAPAWRRRGVGRALLGAALAECRRRGVGALLTVDEAAPAGAPFALACGGRLAGREHRLTFDPAGTAPERRRPAGLAVREAGPGDVELLARLQAESFGDPIELTRASVLARAADPRRRYLVGELGGRPVGLMRVARYEDGSADIAAFGVLPDAQGLGVGRAMLREAVVRLLSEGRAPIQIEAEAHNARALGLYQSCGFRITASYSYYELAAGGPAS